MKTLSKKFVISALVVFSIIFAILGTSALAAEVDTTIEVTEQEAITEEEVIVSTVEEDGTVGETSETIENINSADLESIETYLEYITGFLLFFVICFLFWASYKFFKMFF